MSDEISQKAKPSVMLENELNMFAEYLKGKNATELAEMFKCDVKQVYELARTNKWRQRKVKSKESAYKKLLYSYKQQVVEIVKVLEKDLSKIHKEVLDYHREMTKDERAYHLAVYDRFIKEIRLSENKPTEITEGSSVVEHKVVLPPGTLGYGVIPPPKNVTLAEQEKEDIKEIEIQPSGSDDDKDF